MEKRKRRKIIEDPKTRGEWAESVFVGRASEQGLAVSKPWGDSKSFDFVVGKPGNFVSVQVKCTVAELDSGEGYVCSLRSSQKAYRPGAFDFVAAYVVLEDLWYIIPAKEICGLKSISLCTEGGKAKYEKYREAWHLLQEATGCKECEEAEAAAAVQPEPMPMGPAVVRMQNAFNFFRRQLERGGVTQKSGDQGS